MILTVTLNAALDVTYRVPRLLPHGPHQVADVVERPGGKGVAVARVAAALGHETTATGLAGGRAGEALRDGLARSAPGVADAFVPVRGDTRRSTTVVDEATGGRTVFDEPGPPVTAREWTAFLAAYRELLDGARAVALCGGLPPGVAVGVYADLVRVARAAGAFVLLDTGGAALRRGIAARPDAVCPEPAELARLTGLTDPPRAAGGARRRGARAVVAASGPGALLAVTDAGTWRSALPGPPAGDPAGAGEAAVAGLLSGVADGLAWPDRLARATAAGPADRDGGFDPGAYADLLPRVTVDGLGRAA